MTKFIKSLLICLCILGLAAGPAATRNVQSGIPVYTSRADGSAAQDGEIISWSAANGWWYATAGGFAPTTAKYWTSEASGDLSAEVNLGALTTGLIKHTVAAGVSTPATATPDTDYTTPTGLNDRLGGAGAPNATELGYVKGATSSLQSQIGALGAGGVPWLDVVVTTTNKLDDILAAVPAAGTTILVGSSADAAARTLDASTNRSLPAGVTLEVLEGFPVIVPTGRTLVISGTIKAGPYQVFSCVGTGTVTINSGPRWFRWFGAVGDGSTDDSAAIDDTFNSRSNSYDAIYLGHPGDTYKISSQVTFGFGLSYGKTIIDGRGAKILVDVSTLGAEKITNTAFADATDWTLGTGWAVAGGTANHSAGNVVALETDVTAARGECYLVVLTVSGRSAGGVCVTVGTTIGPVVTGADGTYTFCVTAKSTGNFQIIPTTDFDGSIDNVSCKKTAVGFYLDGNIHAASNYVKVKDLDFIGSNTTSPRGVGFYALEAFHVELENVGFRYLGAGVVSDGSNWLALNKCSSIFSYKILSAFKGGTTGVISPNGTYINDMVCSLMWDNPLDISSCSDFSANWISLDLNAKGFCIFEDCREVNISHLAVEGCGWDNVTDYLMRFSNCKNISLDHSRLLPQPVCSGDNAYSMTYTISGGSLLTSLLRFEDQCSTIRLASNSCGAAKSTAKFYVYSHDDTCGPVHISKSRIECTGFTANTPIHIAEDNLNQPVLEGTALASANNELCDLGVGDISGRPNYWWSILPGSSAPVYLPNWNNATLAWDGNHGRATNGSYKVTWTGAAPNGGIGRRIHYPGTGTYYGVMTFYIASDTAQGLSLNWINTTTTALKHVNLAANKNKWTKVSLLTTVTFPTDGDCYALELVNSTVTSGNIWIADPELYWFSTMGEALLAQATLTRFNRTTYGSELITNGDMAANTGWTYTGWTWSDPYFTHDTGNTSPLTRADATVVAGTVYDLIIYLGGGTGAGTVVVSAGGDSSAAISNNANHRAYMVRLRPSATTAMAITPSSDFDGSVHYCYMRAVQ